MLQAAALEQHTLADVVRDRAPTTRRMPPVSYRCANVRSTISPRRRCRLQVVPLFQTSR